MIGHEAVRIQFIGVKEPKPFQIAKKPEVCVILKENLLLVVSARKDMIVQISGK
jgi:hypothetical protein